MVDPPPTDQNADPGADKAELFEQERRRLFGLAYRMLGSVADADDVVQEAWLRFEPALDIERPAAFLTTVVSRLAIDQLRSAQRRREAYVGPWLPEPLLTDESERNDPAHVIELDETVTLGFLRVLEQLGPVDRAVFLLHDVFGTGYPELAEMLDRSEANCRQIAKRARDKIRAARPASSMDQQRQVALLADFTTALFTGDTDKLTQSLAHDVMFLSDGGPHRRAARQPVVGPERVARFLVNSVSRRPVGAQAHPVQINGRPAMAVVVHDEVDFVTEVEFDDEHIRRFHTMLNPDKLAAVRESWIARNEPSPGTADR